jgi:hypothetical protein
MAETILWYILLLAIGAGVVFTYAIADDLFHQWRLRKNIKKKLETENHRAVERKAVQRTIDIEPIVRGYDSPDLFREDALIRIRELKRKIETDLKKGE